MTDQGKPWEPDPRRMGNWTAMFESKDGGQQRQAAQPPSPTPVDEEFDDAATDDTGEYKPWRLQRGRSRPVMMLAFRQYEPRSGLFCGWAISYPCLVALEYTGDSFLTLDFGMRQVVIEGRGLYELARHIEESTVISIHEHSPKRWATYNSGPIVTAIRKVIIE